MTPALIKIFATALALSQVTTRPDAVTTWFDPVHDQSQIAELLSDGCARMKKSFDVEDVNLDDLIATAMDDTGSGASEIKALKGTKVADLYLAYRQFCKREQVKDSPIDLGQVAEFYNQALTNLPDAKELKDLRLPEMSTILDNKGLKFAEVFTPGNRRVWISYSEIPEITRKAFVAAEDRRFFEHKGVDERGLVRAFIGNLANPNRPQGGSTITQQVVKNLIVGNDVTYERKLREIVVASRVEQLLSKEKILEIYLNSIYLGRGAWGIEMAARSYFGKSATSLTLAESALLAGLAKGPNYFSPDRHPDRARERLHYVFGRMHEDGIISPPASQPEIPALISFQAARRDSGFYFAEYVAREAHSAAGIDTLTNSSYTVQSTINPALQRSVEAILQEGLARYEISTGRINFQGPEMNIGEVIKTLAPNANPARPAWLMALRSARLPLYDVHWERAVVMDNARDRHKADTITVGISDGRVLPLNTFTAATRRVLKPNDVVYVQIFESTGGKRARAELRTRPKVEGAALIIENGTGRILAMTGGFSYAATQLNRVVQALRQPGSTFKPLTYLAALREGLQPNTIVLDEPITLPPIGNIRHPRPRGFWQPKNFDGRSSGPITMRRAIEQSRNLATANLLAFGLQDTPALGLEKVCELAIQMRLYKQCERYYPFILGAQPARLIDLVAFYSAIATEGTRPEPYAIESIEKNGRKIYKHSNSMVQVASTDRASFFQLRSMLQGVVEHGTARAIRHLAPFVGGKTGTTQDEGDAWFVGFTNEVTIGIWVGYDNGGQEHHVLGRGQTGAKVALPMFEPLLQSAWTLHASKTPLNPPSPQAMRDLVAVQIDRTSGDPVSARSKSGITEYFKRDDAGNVQDTQFRVVPKHRYAFRTGDEDEDTPDEFFDARRQDGSSFGLTARRFQQEYSRGWRDYSDDELGVPRRPRRIDPDYVFSRPGLF